MEAAKGNRWGRRDATTVLVAYRHGLRPFELVATSTGIRWTPWYRGASIAPECPSTIRA
jgi:hypothetical protein